MKRTFISLFILIIFSASMFAVALRGISGNPTADDLNTLQWKEDGPLELSPDRGRFALLFSVVEDKSLQFSLPIARFATPDLAITNGTFVSLFAPAVSFLVIPGYFVGKYFGAAQVGTFSVIVLFALMNILLIRAIATRLGAHPIAATIGALAFAFATPAFTYAVTLYQHHISIFLLLLSLYCLIRWNTLWSMSIVWALFGFSIVVDNPNAFLMAPIALYALRNIFSFERAKSVYLLTVSWVKMVLAVVAIIPLALFGWYNFAATGNPFQLPGTLPSVQAIDVLGNPIKPTAFEGLEKRINPEEEQADKSAIKFFKTRHLLNGFYIHFISPDRGIIYYAPVILFGIYGLVVLYRRNPKMANLLVATIGVNVLLYSMWGDPWGGWAFGSRYLIPTYAILGIGIGLALSAWRKKYAFILAFLVVFAYSSWVNALGAVTSSRNPPQVEVLELEKLSGHEEKYTFARNMQYLDRNQSKSFVFQVYGNRFMNAWQYHWLLTTLIVGAVLILFVAFVRGKEDRYEK